ncbi:LEF-6 [Mocis latipes granulovirus]|uniref:LEF-6 n=1 Tax=Mocis latipes granulovirus TaxID=2072024 RepID=A0A161CD72_9BBAC|nr:LEF-6 [Mocis latipes granulovirus]AKR17511.1 LEF-6 [Mocis latipes granulovirus]
MNAYKQFLCIYIMNKKIKLHNLSHKLYPLWLTKSLITYMGGCKLSERIDWHKSTRRCLYVKSFSDANKIIDCHITYPDGFLAVFKTDEMLNEIEQLTDEELTWDDVHI